MVRRDAKYILRGIFGHKNFLRYRVTVGCNGMLITGLVSSVENYVATLGHIEGQSDEPNRVMNAIEIFSTLEGNDELQSGPDVFMPQGMAPEACDDIVVLQDATIQLPNGTVSPVLSFWFGKLSSIDFYMDAPRRAPTLPFAPPQEH